MSELNNITPHIEEFQDDMKTIYELMSLSDTGVYVQGAGLFWHATEEMQKLESLLADESVPEEERSLLRKYMGEILTRDPSNGLLLFANYLKTLVENPQYASLKGYHTELMETAIKVSNTQEYKDYVILYKDFENDTSVAAIAAKDAIAALQNKIQYFRQAV